MVLFGKFKDKFDMTNSKIADFLDLSEDNVKKWNDNRLPRTEYLKKLSDKYKVSLDYLIGKDVCTSVNNQYIHEQTGLSDNAIKTLKKLNSKYSKYEDTIALQAINKILDNPDLAQVFYYIGEYLNLDGEVMQGYLENAYTDYEFEEDGIKEKHNRIIRKDSSDNLYIKLEMPCGSDINIDYKVVETSFIDRIKEKLLEIKSSVKKK